MKNKVGAQKGAFIKMKQENIYIYQWVHGFCYVPIIITKFNELRVISTLLAFHMGQIWDTIAKNRVDLLSVFGQVIWCQMCIPTNHFQSLSSSHFLQSQK